MKFVKMCIHYSIPSFDHLAETVQDIGKGNLKLLLLLLHSVRLQETARSELPSNRTAILYVRSTSINKWMHLTWKEKENGI
jgi:hypothetical protein